MFGVYLHIPFCAQKCSYCDFHFSTSFSTYREQMIAAIVREMEMRAPSWQEKEISTVYFGGGTPSLLTENELRKLVNAIHKLAPVSKDAEITLECNPDDCSEEKLHFWKAIGINRLSIGIQSFRTGQLRWMNRTHNAEEATAAIQRAYACGFRVLTCDLIYGLPGMDLIELQEQLDTLIQLDVDHISAYCLTVEQKTVLAAKVKTGELLPAEQEEQARQFLFLVDYLEQKGYEQYEISNFARRKAYSRHNSSYWKGVPYLGIGPSAHGFSGDERYWNVANNRTYMKQIEKGELPEEREQLSVYDRFNELLLVGLRTIWGVSLNELLQLIPDPGIDWFEKVENYTIAGLLLTEQDQLVLTKNGRLQADGIASDLFILGELQ